VGIDLQQAANSARTLTDPETHFRINSLGGATSRPERSETGVWIAIFAIVMSFAAFTSAMIVRQGVTADWQHFQLPRILYANTLVLMVSSATLGLALRRMASLAPVLSTASDRARKFYSDGMSWLHVTLALGALFVVGQVLGWRTLAAQGLFLSTNPSSSFFYVFTAMHALHLVGGIVGLAYVIRKLARTNGTAQTTGLRAISLYWHFMGGLWLYLLILLMVRT
jgi:cytochrome c oxidase subunit III